MIAGVICAFTGAFLLSSAWSKLRRPESFRAIAAQYPFPRVMGERRLVWMIPWIEFTLALAVLTTREPYTLWGVAGTCLFLITASAAVLGRVLRGERRFRCGCGGDLSQSHSAGWILLRNFTWLLLLSRLLVGTIPAAAGESVVPSCFAGVGLLASLKLAEAAHSTWRAITEWKVSG
jgi:Methylamine utilisation protein MauE